MDKEELENRKSEKLAAISKIIQTVEKEMFNHRRNGKMYALAACMDILEYLEDHYHNVGKWYDEVLKEKDTRRNINGD